MNIDALGLLATFVLENGERWGALAHDNQWLDAFAILDPASATPFHFLTRARGWSKTTDLAALLLAVMICQLPPGARLYGVAASKDQARLLLDAAHGFIERTPLLRGALMVQHNRVILSARDIILEVVAADAARLWGRRPHFFVVDELAQWPTTTGAQRVWEATRSAMAKTPRTGPTQPATTLSTNHSGDSTKSRGRLRGLTLRASKNNGEAFPSPPMSGFSTTPGRAATIGSPPLRISKRVYAKAIGCAHPTERAG